MTANEKAGVIYDLNAIAQYAEKARALLAHGEIGTDLDKAAMQMTWTLQAVKAALHKLNGVKETKR